MSSVCWCGDPECLVTSMSRDACLDNLRAERDALRTQVKALEDEVCAWRATARDKGESSRRAAEERDALKAMLLAERERMEAWLTTPGGKYERGIVQSVFDECDALRAQVEKLRSIQQEHVDGIVHYRNLAIGLGAKPEMMLNDFDRNLARKGVSLTERTPGHWEMVDSLEELAEQWRNVDQLRVQVEKVRKHEAREASFRARQAIARYVAQELSSSHDEHEAAEIRALIERWEP